MFSELWSSSRRRRLRRRYSCARQPSTTGLTILCGSTRYGGVSIRFSGICCLLRFGACPRVFPRKGMILGYWLSWNPNLRCCTVFTGFRISAPAWFKHKHIHIEHVYGRSHNARGTICKQTQRSMNAASFAHAGNQCYVESCRNHLFAADRTRATDKQKFLGASNIACFHIP